MAALFAATYPARTQALVLYGTYATRLRRDDYPWGVTLEERLEYAATVEAEWGVSSDMSRTCPNADDAMAEWWQRRARAAASPGAARALIEMNSRIDIREVLPSIRVPTLVLHRLGDLDAVWRKAASSPGACRARFLPLPGSDHVPWIDADQVLGPIEEFVDEVTVAPAGAEGCRRAGDGGDLVHRHRRVDGHEREHG